ncbi:hypothetical protein D3C85_622520 [compost metagenome]
MNPALLYHGSLYKQNELKPGFQHTGKLVQWDGIENNTYLYTTSEKPEAISLGLGSALEKVLDSRRYATYDNHIVVYFFGDLPDVEKLRELEIYVYTIRFKDTDGWVKNNNPLNNIDTEWVTQATIRGLLKCERVDVEAWLRDKNLLFTTRSVDTCPKSLVDSSSQWGGKTIKVEL